MTNISKEPIPLFSHSKEPRVCLVCGALLQRWQVKEHLAGHAITVVEYKQKFNLPDVSKKGLEIGRTFRKGKIFPKERDAKTITVNCSICGKPKEMILAYYNYVVRRGQKYFSCSSLNCKRLCRNAALKQALKSEASRKLKSKLSLDMWAKRSAQERNAIMSKAIATANKRKGLSSIEQQVNNYSKEVGLPLKFTGDNPDYSVDGLLPDFTATNNLKNIVEIHGCYHHNCIQCFKKWGREPHKMKISETARQEIYERSGYSRLVIWEHELENDAWKDKLIKFLNFKPEIAGVA